MSSLQPPSYPRSPLSRESSTSSSLSSSSSALVDNMSNPSLPPGAAAPASPPYLSVHPSRTPYGTGAGPGAGQPSGAGSAPRPPPLRIATSPARAHTHRTLSAGTQQPPTPYINPSGPRDLANTPPPRVNHSTVAATPSAAAPATTTHSSYSVPLASPCFVHSHLDPNLNGSAATAAAIKAKKKARARPAELAHDAMAKRTGDDATDKTPTRMPGALQSGYDGDGNEEEDAADEDEDEEGGDSEDERNTWTRQLAETAVSVREMSRQLGRARVVSHIQSVMIVTKARDNQLTKLTRELALYLMKKPRNGKDRGLVVYVDSQLRKSKRFDAEGIERENPELFRPLPHRRYSRSSSSASLATDVGPLRTNGTTSGHSRGTLTPLTMTNLGDALVKRNNSIGGSSTLSSRRAQGNGQGREQEAEEGQLRYWTNEMCRKSPHLFDFVITLGGDGTVLYTSWLFQQVVPPVIPFALGSLGFLTNFDYADFRPTLDAAIETGVRVNLRMRFTCTVYRAVDEGDDSKCRRQAIRSGKTGGILMKSLTREGWEAIENGQPLSPNTAGASGGKGGKDKAIKCFSTRPVESFEVLNDLVVDRGPSPYVSQLELFGDEHHMTTVQADGLTVSTPTGSTAYSLSAGGSLVHPEIPAILITPICPHTLSFRPMLLPDSMELRICVPYNSRSTAWASFDGRGRVELRQGDHIKVTASPYPFPTVCADKQSTDWFHSIARTLKWNERQRQKSFVILEEGRKKPRPSDASGQNAGRADSNRASASASAQTPLSPATEGTRGRSPSKRGDRQSRQSTSRGAAKRATFADTPTGDPVCEYDDDEDEDELEDDDDDTAEEYDIDDVSESSPSISASDPPAPAGGIPSMSSKSTSPNSDAGANGSSRPSMEAATTTRLSFHRPDFELLSNASSVSVDIQDDVTERFCDIPPKGRARSRSRARLQQEQAQKRSSRSGGGAVSIDESDDDKSRDRAFAVLGHDDDDSSQASGTESGTW